MGGGYEIYEWSTGQGVWAVEPPVAWHPEAGDRLEMTVGSFTVVYPDGRSVSVTAPTGVAPAGTSWVTVPVEVSTCWSAVTPVDLTLDEPAGPSPDAPTWDTMRLRIDAEVDGPPVPSGWDLIPDAGPWPDVMGPVELTDLGREMLERLAFDGRVAALESTVAGVAARVEEVAGTLERVEAGLRAVGGPR